MRELRFEVIGTPAPQGSKRHVGHGVMVESSKAVKPWRDSVASRAREVMIAQGIANPLDCPLRLTVLFRFSMPKSRRKADRERGVMRKTTSPDLDKLVRAVCDSLKAGGLIRDDALICETMSAKDEVVGWTGAVIILSDPVFHQGERT